MSKTITQSQFEAFYNPHNYHSDTQNAYSFDTQFHLHRTIHLKDVNKVIVLNYDLGCYGTGGGNVTIGVNDCNKPARDMWKQLFYGTSQKEFKKLNLETLISNERKPKDKKKEQA
jgi:hypothetical protein